MSCIDVDCFERAVPNKTKIEEASDVSMKDEEEKEEALTVIPASRIGTTL